MSTDAAQPPATPATPNALPPQYTPADVEADMAKRWADANAYAANATDAGEPFSICIPPPNVTAALHLGHALNNTLQDVLTRAARMQGRNAVWLPGTDHAGIATQTVVDKRLQAEGKKALKDYKRDEAEGNNGRQAFIAEVQKWKDEYETRITDQLKAMGCSCDWDRQAFTMDDARSKAVREAFFQLFKDGLIYRGKRLVNWDPVTQTALADDEVEMEDVDGNFYYLRYPVCDAEGNETGDHVTVATTRPETMLGDTAVAVNPNDPPRAKYVGQYVKLPIVNRVIPIIADDYVVIPDEDSDDPKARMASGFLKVTPAHDPNDYDIGQRHTPDPLPIINVMAPDASISITHGWPPEEQPEQNEELQPFIGLSREDARREIVKWFKSKNLCDQIVSYRHAVGHSYRSHVPVEPYYSDQWYLKVTDDKLRGAALRALDASQRTPSDFFSSSGTGFQPVTAAKQRPSLHQSRRNLPHWTAEGSTYFVTFRVKQAELTDAERQIVLGAATHWHGQRMTLHAAVVMPDHVHLLLKPLPQTDGTDHPLSDLLHSIKSFSAHELNKRRNDTGSIWQDESFDLIVRDEDEFDEKAHYILHNPVKAGLVTDWDDYPYTVTASAIRADHRRDACATKETEQASGGTGSGTGVPPVIAAKQQNDPTTGLRFTPERYAKTFQTWHENLRDWCISRQLWWGHRIPVWSKQVALAESNWTEHLAGESGLDSLLKDSERGCVRVRRLSDGVEVDPKAELMPVVPSTEGEYELAVCLRDESDAEQLEANGFERDPDVLDTWFSSALWPMSTLGWLEESADLDLWNPTSVLCTAREIITLWVSRMVMFNLYFRGTLPFKDVFIHAMIQDGHGQKMSKSLGNGVDPIDIIHSHGSDAMRFTLASMTTQTQDVRMPVDMVAPGSGASFTPKFVTTKAGHKVAAPIQEHDGVKMVSSYGAASGEATPTDDLPLARNTSEKFDLGQRFANKMWNATRFALTKLDFSAVGQASSLSTGKMPVPPEQGPSLPERWILSRLARTVKQCDDALQQYAFSEYATALYDFFWRDLCDWYIEAVKPRIGESPNMQRTLAACLDAALRLLHPVMPFVTERLWEALNAAWPDTRSLDGLMLQPSELLVTASWPHVADVLIDPSAEDEFARLQETVGAIREARNRAKVPPRETIELSSEEPAAIAKGVAENRWIAEGLANFRGREFGPRVEAPEGAAVVLAGGCKIYLHGLGGNSAEEAERLNAEAGALRKSIQNFEGRLSNKKYVDKAPAKLVQETRDQLAAAQKQLETIETQLAALG